jgi:uncharacterized membrane protein
MSKKTYLFFAVAALGALLGLIYSGYSTADFVSHLDRQFDHPINCTLLPGLAGPSSLDQAEGCKVAMFSPFSSFWRDQYWGGVPWSLFAMGLFGFALAVSVWGIASRRGHRLLPGLFLLLAGVVAAGASLVFFWVAATKLHNFCTTCIGTYISSAILLIGAALAFLTGRSDRRAQPEAEPPSTGALLIGAAVLSLEMGLAAFLPVVVYTSTVPDYTKYVTSCETLKVSDERGGMIQVAGKAGGADAILVLDPLCPACKAFHKRLAEAEVAKGLTESVFLLPLDAECNWMLKDSMHPGACLLSRALLCAGSDAGAMLDFIFDNQEQMRSDGLGKALGRIQEKLLAKFPGVKTCMDTPETKKKLNDSLHKFAVANALPVVTPQLYVNGKRVCDDDTDLGLEYALAKLLGK